MCREERKEREERERERERKTDTEKICIYMRLSNLPGATCAVM
jgi:hypothetical protein